MQKIKQACTVPALRIFSETCIDGTARAALPPGRYHATVYKGLEYRPQTSVVTVARNGTVHARLALERWIDMPAEGWLGSDDHLHLPRTSADDDPDLARWMQAEDLHVANLLQMGTPDGVRAAPQMAFGPGSVFTLGSTRIVSGQENPRTHNFGHGIVVGAPRYIDFPQRYLVYGDVFRAAERAGGLAGYAHFGTGGARNGLAVDAPTGDVDFLEVLQVKKLETAVLYEMWNLGIRLAPTAGTDYPCGGIASLPGQERFYTRIQGTASFASWLEGLATGRTFVTNGPMLALEVNGHTVGESLSLPEAGTVQVRASVRFDPTSDQIEALELVRGGEVIARATETSEPGRIELRASPRIERSSWLALRAEGRKVRTAGGNRPPSLAHTATVEITVDGTPSLAEQAAGIRVARESLERVDGLEGFIRKAGISESDRAGLLEAIAAAQRLYRARLDGSVRP